MQKIINGEKCHRELGNILRNVSAKKFLLVCGGSFEYLPVKEYLMGINIPFVKFNGFAVNPIYDDVVRGTELFKKEDCDAIVAIGGGSSIDVAKCIKLFAKMPNTENYLKQEFFDSGIPLIAVPTTAGTGSESTRYAVIYYEGRKQSVTHDSIIPDYALLDASLLKTLPLYQKKCTLLDALCQGIEAWWSVNSDSESFKYSEIAVKKIIKNYEAYLSDNDESVISEILIASNFAGRAINITQTTAAHAMSYKLTSLFALPHGHAVAVCLPHIWRYMLNNPDRCIDSRGKTHLFDIFNRIAEAMDCPSPQAAVEFFINIITSLDINAPKATQEELEILAASVNLDRLKNNPVELDGETVYKLYAEITK